MVSLFYIYGLNGAIQWWQRLSVWYLKFVRSHVLLFSLRCFFCLICFHRDWFYLVLVWIILLLSLLQLPRWAAKIVHTLHSTHCDIHTYSGYRLNARSCLWQVEWVTLPVDTLRRRIHSGNMLPSAGRAPTGLEWQWQVLEAVIWALSNFSHTVSDNRTAPPITSGARGAI